MVLVEAHASVCLLTSTCPTAREPERKTQARKGTATPAAAQRRPRRRTRVFDEALGPGHVDGRRPHQLVGWAVGPPAREALGVGAVVEQGVALFWLDAAADLLVYLGGWWKGCVSWGVWGVCVCAGSRKEGALFQPV